MRVAIGIDVGGSQIKVGLVGVDGSLTDQQHAPTPHGADAIVAAIAAQVHTLTSRHGLAAATPVGVVAPGIVDEARGVVELAGNLGWHDLPLRDMVHSAIGSHAVVGHDVRAGAVAESAWGAGRTLSAGGLADLMFLPLGTGIAIATIWDGRLLGDRYVGEIGQVLVPDPAGGPDVRMELVSSASAIARRYGELAGEQTSAREVVARAASGDATATTVLGQATDALAQVLAGTIGGIGPIPLVVGGGLAQAGDIVLGPLRDRLDRRLGVVPAPPVLAAQLGMWAGCLGAGHLALTAAGDVS